MGTSYFLWSCIIALFSASVAVEDSDVSSLKEQMLHLQKTLTNRIQILENVVVEQNKEIKTLRNEIITSKDMAESKCLKKENIDSIPDEGEIEEGTPYQKRAETTPVAFYVYLNNDIGNPGQRHSLVFDVVITNTASGYNKYSGMFKVPVSGVYVFAANVAMNGDREFSSYEIVRNSDVKGTFFVDAQYTNGYVYGSMTIVIEVEMGDIVYVRTGGLFQTQGNVFSRPYARSSFAGWRIQ